MGISDGRLTVSVPRLDSSVPTSTSNCAIGVQLGVLYVAVEHGVVCSANDIQVAVVQHRRVAVSG